MSVQTLTINTIPNNSIWRVQVKKDSPKLNKSKKKIYTREGAPMAQTFIIHIPPPPSISECQEPLQIKLGSHYLPSFVSFGWCSCESLSKENT